MQNLVFFKYVLPKIEILSFKEENDAEIQEIVKLDSERLTKELDVVVNELTDAIIPVTEYDSLNNCQLEITPLVFNYPTSKFILLCISGFFFLFR